MNTSTIAYNHWNHVKLRQVVISIIAGTTVVISCCVNTIILQTHTAVIDHILILDVC